MHISGRYWDRKPHLNAETTILFDNEAHILTFHLRNGTKDFKIRDSSLGFSYIWSCGLFGELKLATQEYFIKQV